MYRPVDLARPHGLTPQAVRNYERRGAIPPARRTASGYRAYTREHVAALAAYLALVAGHGHATATEVMRRAVAGDVDGALCAIDRSHAELARDRATLDAVLAAVGLLAGAPPAQGRSPDPAPGPSPAPPPGPVRRAAPGPVGVGPLAHRLGVSPATLRAWERAGVLAPGRNRATGHRVYGPDDVRDAELAHLLRRGGLPLAQVATVVRQARSAGGGEALAASLAGRRAALTARGRAMLVAAGLLAGYLAGYLADRPTDQPADRPDQGSAGGA